LEQRLAARLFDRLQEGFVPTVAGAELLPLAEEMERSAEALERRQASLADTVSGTVRLSVMEAMARFLAEFMRELRERQPEIEIELAFTHLGANLSKREADLLIRECMPDNPGLIARKLGSLSYAIYGEIGLVERNPAARGEARYRDCPWVGYDEEHSHFTEQQWLLERLAGRIPAVRVNNGLVLHEAVRRGAGLGVLPCFSGDWDPALVRLSPPVAELDSTQYLIVHRDLRRTPSVRAVMDELVVLFQREAPRLVGHVERAAKTA
jgi:DNA-binding transcriptional LysR family regulator